MFRKLRQKDIKRILWFLVIIIVPAFILWGAAGLFKERTSKSYMILGKKVSQEEFNTFLRNIQIFYYFNTGRSTLDSISQKQWQSIAWQNLILAKKAELEGIKASNEEVLQQIQQLPAAKTSEGFSKERYLRMFSQVKITPGQFERFLKEKIKTDKLKDRIYSGISATEEEIRQKYKTANQQAKIKYSLIEYQKEQAQIEPSEEELKEFYQDKKEEFRKPPEVKISYILLKGSDKDLLPSIQSEIKTAGSLKEIADKFGLDLIESGFFTLNSPIKGLGWQKDVKIKSFSIKKGQITDAIQTSEGLVILQKIGEKASYIPDYSQITQEVKTEYIGQKARQKSKDFAEEVIDKIKKAGIKDLSSINKYFPQLEVEETDFFKQNDFVENIGLNPTFNKKVFALKEKEILQEPVQLKKGIYIIQLLELKPIDEEKFQEEKEEYRQEIITGKRRTALFSYLQDLIQQN